MQVENLTDDQKVATLMRRASGYAASSQPTQAIADLEAAKKLAPDNPDVIAALADVSHFIGGREDAAIEGYKALLAKNPNDIDTLMKLGMSYLVSKDYPSASAAFGRVIELDPKNVKALIFHSSVITLAYKLDEALQDLDRAVALEPNNLMARDWRGEAELEVGKFDLAIPDFDFVIAAHPDTGLRRFRGAAKFGVGDFAGAVADFDYDLQHSPNLEHLLAWRYLAEKRSGGGSDAELLATASTLEGRWPADLLLFVAGQRNAAQALASAKTKDPAMQKVRESQANFVIGEMAWLAGDKASAKQHFDDCQRGGFLFAQYVGPSGAPSGNPMDNVIEFSIARTRLKELSQ
jgi:tetratricopeptide (TPR) repeat protein